MPETQDVEVVDMEVMDVSVDQIDGGRG